MAMYPATRFYSILAPGRRIKGIIGHLSQASSRMLSSAGDQDEVLMERVDSKGIITLNLPKKLNSLNLSMVRKINPQLKLWQEDPGVSMVIIKGTGEKAFCAGGDVRAVTESGKTGGSLPKDFFKEEYILNNRIGTQQVPWVALIDGITMGGGVGLSVHGKFRVATERTVFAMPETAIGLFPDVGGGYFLPRLEGKLGLYLALSGFRLKGRDVQRVGVATHFIESSSKDLLALPSSADSHKGVSEILDRYHSQCNLDNDKEYVLAPHIEKINNTFNGKTLEDIYRNLEKDGSEWASKTLATLQKMSPTSMKVTMEQLRQGGQMSLQEVLQMEYRITQRCVQDHDFYEGVRAVLVDRDHKPQWKPSRIEDVTPDRVAWYLSALPADQELIL